MDTAKESPFIKGFEQFKILRPSVAYHQACKSYPCRISELVFGSLLASYILGFVTIGASQLDPTKIGWPLVVSEGFIYISISCTFCFLTAALYSVYHHSILTMPNVPISDLTTDFLIAISQAILFGVSVIVPKTFLICLGLLLLLVAWRQELKFRALGRFFYDKLKVAIVSSEMPQQSVRESRPKKQVSFRHAFRAKLQKANLLDGWGSLKPTHYLGASFALVFGVLLWIPSIISGQRESSDTSNLQGGNVAWLVENDSWIRATIYLIVGMIVFRQTRIVLQDKSVALDDRGRETIEEMDDKASVLAASIIDSTK